VDPKQEFLILLGVCDHLREILLEKDWELTSEDIKELFTKDMELIPDNVKRIKEWSIEPQTRFATTDLHLTPSPMKQA